MYTPEALCVCLVPGPALVTDNDGGARIAGSNIGQV